MEEESQVQSLSQENRALRDRCKSLEAIIEINNISNLKSLVEQFMISGRTHLRKISLELQVLEHDPHNDSLLQSLTDYLDHVKDELEKFQIGETLHFLNFKKDVTLMKTISFINLKGGVGKTTIATNFAYAAATSCNLRVLFIDNDKQGNSSDWFEADMERGTLTNILMGDAAVQDVIQPTRYANIDIIPADMGLLEANAKLMQDNNREQSSILKKALSSILTDYALCVIDNPPDINMSVFNALCVTDDVVIVTLPDWDSIAGVKKMVAQLSLAKSYNDSLNLKGVLLNGYLSDDAVYGIQSFLDKEDLPVFASKIHYATKNAKKHMNIARRDHLSMFEEYPACQVSRDLWQFMKEFLGVE